MRTMSIIDCGARNGELCTAAIQTAINHMGASGGGTVYVPPGRWLTGTLSLRSGVTLFIAPGAVLEASANLADYTEHKLSNAGNNDRQNFHLLFAEDAEHVTITGGGRIFGNGPAHWLEPDAAAPGGVHWFRPKPQRVSPMVELRNCRHVRIENITLADSPGWTLHPHNCDFLTIRGVIVENNLLGPNTDGFDLNGCRDVFISDCHLTCGDDAIIIKAMSDARSCERVTITNCVVQSNCIGIGIGCETESDVRQIAISNCVAVHCMRMFAVGVWDGGVVEDVVVSNLVGDTITQFPTDRPIHLDVKRLTPACKLGTLRNLSISNVIARTRGRILLTAEDGSMLENITLRDVKLIVDEIDDPTVSVARSRSVQLSNTCPEARRARAAVVVQNALNLQLFNVHVQWPRGEEANAVPMQGLWARNTPSGVVDCPMLVANNPELEPFNLDHPNPTVAEA